MKEGKLQRRYGLTRGQLLFVPAVHPKWDAAFRQLPFTCFFLLSLVIFANEVHAVSSNLLFWVGLAIGVTASVLSLFGTKLVHDGDSWITIVPVLDYIALALVCAVQPEVFLTPMILLSIIPALWLGAIERTYGFIIVVAMSFVTMIPVVAFHLTNHAHFDIAELLSLLLLPTFGAVAAGTMHSMTLRSAMKRRAMLYQEARLEKNVQQERETNRLLDSVIKAVGRGLFVVDHNGQEILVNKLMRSHPLLVDTDLKFADLENLGWFFTADKETLIPEGTGPVARALKGESYSASLYWVGNPEKHEKYAISITSRPLVDADGSLHGAVIALQDVTNFMDALEAKDTFISTVSHELRTPLTSITGYLELIRDEEDSLPEDVKQYLEVAERNTERLLLLVNDLLTVARSDKADMPISPVPSDLGTIVADSFAAFRSAAEAKHISLSRTGLENAQIKCDPIRIAQVVENVLSNAVKYTPDGGSVSISLAENSARHGYDIVVTDTGMGIPVEEQSQLFTKFYRALAVRNGAIPGMGLGLSICQKIVEAHDGQLMLTSKPGVGTRVTVFLPTAD